MGSLQEQHRSLWVETTSIPNWPTFEGDLQVDVAVIGAGISGLSVAARLKQDGARVAVIEAGRIASGATGYTTAKVTSQHNLIYADLVDNAGHEHARQYAGANEAAIAEIARNIEEIGIDCDFHRADAHVYTSDPQQVEGIQREVEAAISLGLPATFTEETGLPYPIAGAVKFRDQAMFHPRKYCLGLAEHIAGDGSHVFENTQATNVECDGDCVVTTDTGTIRAGHVVMATHIPFLVKGGYFAKTHPARSYAVAAKLRTPVLSDMYIGIDSPIRSLRPHTENGEAWQIIGGEGHKVGQDPDTSQRYKALENWTRDHFDVESIEYRWSAQDYMAVDSVPYIGPITNNTERILIATGFNKWGMTTGAVAGMILSDTINGRTSEYADVFASTRMDIGRSARNFLLENANVAKRFIGDRLRTLSVPDISELGPDEGGIVNANGEKVAAYRDDSGALHAVSPICTHLGCQVTWNTGERTWDCPCHGSRFGIDGDVIQGPAITPLESKNAD